MGEFEGKEVKANIGRFGPYLLHDNKFYSIPKPDDPYSVDETKAIEIILAKREAEQKRLIKEFSEDSQLRLLNGRWGPYISYGKGNFRIPKGTKAEELTFDQCMEIIEKQAPAGKGKAPAEKKAAAKKPAVKKKAPAKKTARKKKS